MEGQQKLSLDQIAEITRTADTKPRTGGRSRAIDISDRTYPTWFKLEHHLIDSETKENLRCEVPEHDIADFKDSDGEPVSRERTVAMVNGVWCCRYCFLAGFASA